MCNPPAYGVHRGLQRRCTLSLAKQRADHWVIHPIWLAPWERGPEVDVDIQNYRFESFDDGSLGSRRESSRPSQSRDISGTQREGNSPSIHPSINLNPVCFQGTPFPPNSGSVNKYFVISWHMYSILSRNTTYHSRINKLAWQSV